LALAAPLSSARFIPTGAGQSRHRHRSQTAVASHKRILLDFGGDWCGDCQVLDATSTTQTTAILDANFVLVT